MSVKVQPPSVKMPIGKADKNGDVYLTPYGQRHMFDMWQRTGGFDDGVFRALLAAALGEALVANITARLEEIDADTRRLTAQTETVAQGLAEASNDTQAAVANLRALVQSVAADDLLQVVKDLQGQISALRAQIESLRGEDTLSAIQSLTTDQVSEGTINLYFTQTRARNSISVTGSLAYNAGTGVISYTTPNSDGITEGSTNLYFTQARARASVSATGDLSYNSATGVFSYTTPTNSGTASKWQTARTLSYTGDVTGSGSVDGSANVAFTLTIAAGHVTPAMLSFSLGTASAENTGTSGHTIPFLDGTNTWANEQRLSGNVRLGTYTVSALAPITGYITIKDDAGNSRNLAVV